jgi:hypothetical protein
MSVQRVRRAWDYLRRTADMDAHLSQVKLVTDGQSIFRVAESESELVDSHTIRYRAADMLAVSRFLELVTRDQVSLMP